LLRIRDGQKTDAVVVAGGVVVDVDVVEVVAAEAGFVWCFLFSFSRGSGHGNE